MFCVHCGAPNPEDASFCNTCGKAIGAPAIPPPPAEAPQHVLSRAETPSGNATGQILPPIASPAQPPPPPHAEYPPPAAGKGKPVLWILAGFGACLLIIITMAVGSRLNQPPPDNPAPDPPPTAAPATYSPDSTPAPAADNTPAPAAENAPAPANVPVQAPPQPAPQNPIVGDWKATTYIGSTIGLHLGADGRYVLNPGSDEGVYVFSAGDGTLRLQSNSFFSNGIMVWSCQLSGDSLSCVDPNGGGHVYTRQ